MDSLIADLAPNAMWKKHMNMNGDAHEENLRIHPER
jgi:hypothetical protein